MGMTHNETKPSSELLVHLDEIVETLFRKELEMKLREEIRQLVRRIIVSRNHDAIQGSRITARRVQISARRLSSSSIHFHSMSRPPAACPEFGPPDDAKRRKDLWHRHKFKERKSSNC